MSCSSCSRMWQCQTYSLPRTPRFGFKQLRTVTFGWCGGKCDSAGAYVIAGGHSIPLRSIVSMERTRDFDWSSAAQRGVHRVWIGCWIERDIGLCLDPALPIARSERAHRSAWRRRSRRRRALCDRWHRRTLTWRRFVPSDRWNPLRRAPDSVAAGTAGVRRLLCTSKPRCNCRQRNKPLPDKRLGPAYRNRIATSRY
jgi:hypothetical protein